MDNMVTTEKLAERTGYTKEAIRMKVKKESGLRTYITLKLQMEG